MTVLPLTDIAPPRPRPGDAGQRSGYVEIMEDGVCRLSLLVEGAHCGACVRRIETHLSNSLTIDSARLNLSTRRLDVRWRGRTALADEIVAAIEGLGYRSAPYLAEAIEDRDKAAETRLLKALAVAFFAASNVMMLSWAVWVGHDSDMGQGARAFFHWMSALIAVPSICYAGRPFYASAWSVLRRGRTNMDVPISLGVVLTTFMSLIETLRGGPHVYFDGALSLLFVLLAGRYLDQRVRGKARSAVQDLARLAAQPVNVLDRDGHSRAAPAHQVRADELVLVAAGERIGVDGVVTDGTSSVDMSLINGESAPKPVAGGDKVYAGTLNLAAPIRIRALSTGQSTVLSEIIRLLEAAEQKKGRFVAFADRTVSWYTPVVHILAAGAFLGWLLIAEAGWQIALVNAVSVLIIACPCALGLAVPVTQVVAASRLMRAGILLKSETALERLAGINTIIFDKTGTLTLAEPILTEGPEDDELLRLASGLAGASRHPLAAAIRSAIPNAPVLQHVEEVPGSGLRWRGPSGEARLGSASWCGLEPSPGSGAEAWLTIPGRKAARFSFATRLRPDAVETITALRREGYALAILSGDRSATVAEVAAALEIPDWQAGISPREKIERVQRLVQVGRRVLMVGDGINDAPALAAATASLAPAEAADVTRRAADCVWLGRSLAPVSALLRTARRSRAIIIQNIGFSFVYNAAWVPVAMAGLVTPWVAALAMSASSLAVTLNALRLNLALRRER